MTISVGMMSGQNIVFTCVMHDRTISWLGHHAGFRTTPLISHTIYHKTQNTAHNVLLYSWWGRDRKRRGGNALDDNDIHRDAAVVKPTRGHQQLLLAGVAVARVPVPRPWHLARVSDRVNVPDFAQHGTSSNNPLVYSSTPTSVL